MKKLIVFCAMIVALGFVSTGCVKPQPAPAPAPEVEAPADAEAEAPAEEAS